MRFMVHFILGKYEFLNGLTVLLPQLPLQNEAATDTLVEDLIRQLESSMQQYIGEVPLQTAHIASDMTADMREPSVSVTCQPPETYHVTQSEALQSASKSLQIELERLQKQKNEKLKLHEEMVCLPYFHFLFSQSFFRLMFFILIECFMPLMISSTCRNCKLKWHARKRLIRYVKSMICCFRMLRWLV